MPRRPLPPRHRKFAMGGVLVAAASAALAVTTSASAAPGSQHGAAGKATTLRSTATLRSTTAATTTAATTTAAGRIDPSQGAAAKPYMGWSSWSLESTNYPGVNPSGSESWLTEDHVLQQAQVVATTLKPHGYEYVNIDAGWWNGFDGNALPEVDAKRFPDGIAHVADVVHGEGLKLGIYMPVGLEKDAFGGGTLPIANAPGCTTADLVYPDHRTTNGWDNAYKMNFDNPCSQAYIDSMAALFAGWGVDFLKVDGVGPGSGKGGAQYDNQADVKAWSTAIAKTGRPMQFVISWSLSPKQSDTWSSYTNGWRIDTDVECYCNTISSWTNSVMQRWNDVIPFIGLAGPGHWNNLDSVDVGVGAMDGLTDPERQSEMTLWAIESAPLYSGDDLTKLDSFGTSLLTNDEVIAVDQAGHPAHPVSQLTQQQTWFATNPDGSVTVAQFNLADQGATVTTKLGDVGLDGKVGVRDLWQHKSLGFVNGALSTALPAHGSALYTFTPAQKNEAVPTDLHATGASGTSFDVAWSPVAGASGYDVRVGNKTVATTADTHASVTGLTPATPYTITVTARTGHATSQPSSPLTLTTPTAGGRTLYEAESPDNRLIGNASIGNCSKCSGGKKVGNLGGGGAALLFTTIKAPRAGTYLMTLSYIDGDSSRQAIATVNGTTQLHLNLVGTNDNDWSTPQTVTFPITLAAGTNTIEIGNTSGYVSDIDAVEV